MSFPVTVAVKLVMSEAIAESEVALAVCSAVKAAVCAVSLLVTVAVKAVILVAVAVSAVALATCSSVTAAAAVAALVVTVAFKVVMCSYCFKRGCPC